jgi:hypothetical protein
VERANVHILAVTTVSMLADVEFCILHCRI